MLFRFQACCIHRDDSVLMGLTCFGGGVGVAHFHQGYGGGIAECKGRGKEGAFVFSRKGLPVQVEGPGLSRFA